MEIGDKTFLNNKVVNWLIAALIITTSIILSRVVYWFLKNIIKKQAEKTEGKLDDIIVDTIKEPLIFAIIICGIWYSMTFLQFKEEIEMLIKKILAVMVIFDITWFIARAADSIIKEYVAPIFERSEGNLNNQMVPIIRKAVKIIIWIISGMIALKNAGYDVGAVLAGLGIGGLAFALAAQDTISNLFGGVTIFTDRPFKINDRIKVTGIDGIVKEIGIRSSKIQTLEGRYITLPNSIFAKNPIENMSSEPNRKIAIKLGVTYDTSAEKIEEIIQILKEINKEEIGTEDNSTVFLSEFGDFSINIQYIYYIKKEAVIPEVQTKINLRIIKEFKRIGVEFAYPTQKIYTINNS